MTHSTMKLTPKQRVLQKYPHAYAKDGLMSGDWYIYRGEYGSAPLTGGWTTPKQAWAAAAEKL